MKRLFYTSEKTDNRIFQYFLGFQPSDGWLLIDDETKDVKVFLDGRYLEKAILSSDRSIQKIPYTHNFLSQLGDYLLADELVMLEKSIPYTIHEKLTSPDRERNILFSFEPKPRQNKLRIIKTPKQIDTIHAAIDLTEQVRDQILELANTGELIGKTELGLRAQMIGMAFELGAEAEAFDAIVATGANSAIPHHNTSDTIITEGALLIDMGWKVGGRCSDFTRSLWLGDQIHPEFETILEVTKNAYTKAVSMLEPGVSLALVAQAARKVITDAGYGDFYPHSLGHGVGLDVHEAPRVSGKSEDTLEAGMVITIEPGIYLPGKFGVRWEDMIVIEYT